MQALLAMHYRPVPLAGRSDQKVVDIGIQRTLDALADTDADVLLCSHDGDFAEQTAALLAREPARRPDRAPRVRQHASSRAWAWRSTTSRTTSPPSTTPLPRVRVIPLEEFDPLYFLR